MEQQISVSISLYFSISISLSKKKKKISKRDAPGPQHRTFYGWLVLCVGIYKDCLDSECYL